MGRTTGDRQGSSRCRSSGSELTARLNRESVSLDPQGCARGYLLVYSRHMASAPVIPGLHIISWTCYLSIWVNGGC